jgi:hypothetical protein
MQAVVSERSGRGAVFACSGGFALAVLLMLIPVPKAGAARLGGPYFVDDAEIGKVGSCEVESWNSSAGNGDRISVFSPACVVNFGAPVELGTNLVDARSDGNGISTISLTAKTVPIPIGPSGFGLALSGAVVYDPFQHAASGAIFTVPVTFDLSEKLRLNINVGAQYNADPALLFATGGVGVSWNFADQWSIISEMFAIVGPGTTNPHFQSGIRYSPTKNVDWDVIYGRNLTGEQANWITLALTFRIGDQ